jgi:hypothetical protein
LAKFVIDAFGERPWLNLRFSTVAGFVDDVFHDSSTASFFYDDCTLRIVL